MPLEGVSSLLDKHSPKCQSFDKTALQESYDYGDIYCGNYFLVAFTESKHLLWPTAANVYQSSQHLSPTRPMKVKLENYPFISRLSLILRINLSPFTKDFRG